MTTIDKVIKFGTGVGPNKSLKLELKLPLRLFDPTQSTFVVNQNGNIESDKFNLTYQKLFVK